MSDRRCPECFEILECPSCDPSITHMVHDAGLREAAQAVVDRVDAIDPSFEAQPVPEIEALRSALRSTPAAPKDDDRE